MCHWRNGGFLSKFEKEENEFGFGWVWLQMHINWVIGYIILKFKNEV